MKRFLYVRDVNLPWFGGGGDSQPSRENKDSRTNTESSVSATQASTPGRESAQGTAVDATYLSQIVAHHMSGQSLGP